MHHPDDWLSWGELEPLEPISRLQCPPQHLLYKAQVELVKNDFRELSATGTVITTSRGPLHVACCQRHRRSDTIRQTGRS